MGARPGGPPCLPSARHSYFSRPGPFRCCAKGWGQRSDLGPLGGVWGRQTTSQAQTISDPPAVCGRCEDRARGSDGEYNPGTCFGQKVPRGSLRPRRSNGALKRDKNPESEERSLHSQAEPDEGSKIGEGLCPLSRQRDIVVKAPVLCLLEKAMAPHSSALAWRVPGTGETGGLWSMGSLGVGHD